ncbi:MAG: hypothetical protein PHW24_01970 [Candidatus Moranbacteria bacterium]|nr:hypothetical protein [Candidatus Moranbacteria bacterium]
MNKYAEMTEEELYLRLPPSLRELPEAEFIEFITDYLSEELSSFPKFVSNGTVEEKQKILRDRYNLSNEQVTQITNILYCISENVITSYIKNEKEKSELSKLSGCKLT